MTQRSEKGNAMLIKGIKSVLMAAMLKRPNNKRYLKNITSISQRKIILLFLFSSMAAVNTLFARKIRPFTYNVSFNGELCTLHQLDVFHSNALKRFHGLSNSSGLQHNHIIKLSWRCVHTIAKTFSEHILSAFIDSPTHLTFSTTVELNSHGNV